LCHDGHLKAPGARLECGPVWSVLVGLPAAVHGATPNRLMVHLAPNETDDDHVAAHWGDQVSDEEYNAALG
jgi:hypothetical protein